MGAKGHESDFRRVAEGLKTLSFGAFRGGQRNPRRCPQDYPYPAIPNLHRYKVV